MSRLRGSVLCVLVLVGCVRNEPSPLPLGRGERALAELKLQGNNRAGALTLADSSTAESADVSAESARDAQAPVAAKQQTDSADAGSWLAALHGADAGDGGPPPQASDPSEWLGTWSGKDTTRFVMDDSPERSFDDDQAKIRVARVGEQRISLVLVDSSDGSDLCALDADLVGKMAKLKSGQSCFTSDDGSMEAEIEQGGAKLDKDRLIMDATLKARAYREGTRNSGKILYHFEGSR